MRKAAFRKLCASISLLPVAYLALYQACEWQVVKEVCEGSPHVCVAILAKALIVEAVPARTEQRSTPCCLITCALTRAVCLVACSSYVVRQQAQLHQLKYSHLRDLPAFVVASQYGDAVSEPDFKGY